MPSSHRDAAVPGIAVVVPNWNGLRFLPSCVESVLSQRDVEVELFVVDNGSTDGSQHFLGRSDIRHVALERNMGFARAVNLGFALTEAPLVLVLNMDTLVQAECLSRLAAALEADQMLGGVQPRILQLGSEPARIYSAGQTLLDDGRAFERGAGQPDGPRFQVSREVFGVCGAACLLRRGFFASVGGYDERYFSFYEDVDLNARGRLQGWKFQYVPEAVVLHAGNAGWRAAAARPSAFNARLVARNRLATALKSLPARALPRLLVVETGSLARSSLRGTFAATLAGKLAAVRWLPALLAERRRLRRAGRPELLERCLGTGQ